MSDSHKKNSKKKERIKKFLLSWQALTLSFGRVEGYMKLKKDKIYIDFKVNTLLACQKYVIASMDYMRFRLIKRGRINNLTKSRKTRQKISGELSLST